MSTPKRGAKTTPKATPKSSSKKTSVKKTLVAAKSKAAAKSTVKAASKAAVKSSAKTASKKTPKKVAKKSASKAVKSAAQKVAKKVAKIISKIVAKKKTAAKRPAPKPAQKSASKSTKSALKKAAGKIASAVGSTLKGSKKIRSSAPASRRPKAFAEAEATRGFGFPADTPELPETYGEDRLVLMTKDPEYLFAYWEITPEKRAQGEKAKRRDEEYLEAVRLNWAARDIFERNFAVLPVSLDTRKWYLRVPFSGLSYQIEIGWLGESGHFIALMVSNPSDAPESWNATRRRLKQAAVKGGILERTLDLGRPQGSSDLTSRVAASTSRATDLNDWSFPGPGSTSSSSGLSKRAAKRP